MLKQIMGAMTILAGTTLTSCDDGGASEKNAQKYMRNKPQKELLEVTSSLNQDKGRLQVQSWVNTQSKLDSVAYRDIFAQTKGIKDSALVKKFNTLAAKGLMEEGQIHRKLVETNISAENYDNIIKEAHPKFGTSMKYYERIQHATDSINYKNFFDKHKLLDNNLLKKFDKVCKQIKP